MTDQQGGHGLVFMFFEPFRLPLEGGTKLAIFDITVGENTTTQLGFTEWDAEAKVFGLPEIPVEGAKVQLMFWADCDLEKMRDPGPQKNGKLIQIP